MTRYRVADLIADSLVLHGVDRAFSVPGESFLPLLDALFERNAIDLVTCRHEGSGALAAVADAKLTGRPAVMMVSRGPGLFNAALALHVAEQEAVPLVVLMGQVDTPMLGRGAVQEVDAGKAFAGIVKWTCRINSAHHAAEHMARAFAVATSGVPGPVIVELPEDVLSNDAEAAPSARVHGVAFAAASQSAILDTASDLSAAKRPIMIVGGECRTPQFRDALLRFAEAWQLPVAVTNKGQDQFPNEHPLFSGQLGIFVSPANIRLFEQADLILAVGTRLGDLSSMGFEIPRQSPVPQKLIHVYPAADVIGRQFPVHSGVVSTASDFVSAMSAYPGKTGSTAEWLADVAATREKHHAWRTDAVPAADVLGHTITAISMRAERDCVITTDSGNFASWVHRIFRFVPTQRLLGSACGAMGTGVPSGIAAGMRDPSRQVIAFCGDGGFLMTGNELSIAVARKLRLIVVISNNRSYGTIRSYQQRAYPSRVSGTDLDNPDFAELARAFGATGITVGDAASADAAVEAAFRTNGPVVLDVQCNVDQTVDKTVASFAART